MTENSHVVFDLDDTLYKEIDFVKSAYNYVNTYINNRYKIDFISDFPEILNNILW